MFSLMFRSAQSEIKRARFRVQMCRVMDRLASISNPAATLARLPRALFFSGLLVWACFFVSPSVEAAQGVPDTSFGMNGLAITDFGSNTTGAVSIAIQTDGKIIAVGGTDGPLNFGALIGAYSLLKSRSFTTLARYNRNGVLDTTFGTGGLVTTSFKSNASSGAWAIDVQQDDKIVVAGFMVDSVTSNAKFTLSRFTNSAPPPPSPPIVTLSNRVFVTTGDLFTLRATVTPYALAGTLVDAYVMYTLPGGLTVYQQLDGTFTQAPTPLISNWSLTAVSGALFSYVFTGPEPPGVYSVRVFFTRPGTMMPVGNATTSFLIFGP